MRLDPGLYLSHVCFEQFWPTITRVTLEIPGTIIAVCSSRKFDTISKNFETLFWNDTDGLVYVIFEVSDYLSYMATAPYPSFGLLVPPQNLAPQLVDQKNTSTLKYLLHFHPSPPKQEHVLN